jgi:hypothetical protein
MSASNMNAATPPRPLHARSNDELIRNGSFHAASRSTSTRAIIIAARRFPKSWYSPDYAAKVVRGGAGRKGRALDARRAQFR